MLVHAKSNVQIITFKNKMGREAERSKFLRKIEHGGKWKNITWTKDLSKINVFTAFAFVWVTYYRGV